MPLPQQYEQKEIKKPLEIPESKDAPEDKLGALRESEKIREARPAAPEAAPPPPLSVAMPMASPPDETARAIESIMEENLGDVYRQLSAERKEQFKTKGEETSRKIAVILSKTKVKVHSILNLIKGWLKIIPGVNRYFLEQEAKIKTDKIMSYHLKKRGDQQ
ncbi:MAG: hypothetical protein V1838_01020 [Patescibacteria group bacterium]